MTDRPTPFELVFAGIAEERFGPVREAVVAAGIDPFDRDAVLMTRPMVELIHALRPEGGLGPAMEELVALVHAAFVCWHQDARTARLDDAVLSRLVAPSGPAASPAARMACYAQYPARRIWGTPVAGAPAEPLDGCFLLLSGGRLVVVAVFGMHPGRDGFSVVSVEGERPAGLAREDGSPLFAPALPGGEAAGLHSLVGMEELLELGWRTVAELP